MVTRSYSCRLLSRPSLLVNKLPFGMWFTSCSPETNPKHSVVKGEVVANYWILHIMLSELAFATETLFCKYKNLSRCGIQWSWSNIHVIYIGIGYRTFFMCFFFLRNLWSKTISLFLMTSNTSRSVLKVPYQEIYSQYSTTLTWPVFSTCQCEWHFVHALLARPWVWMKYAAVHTMFEHCKLSAADILWIRFYFLSNRVFCFLTTAPVCCVIPCIADDFNSFF